MLNDAQAWKKPRNLEGLVPGETYLTNVYIKQGVSRVGYYYLDRHLCEMGARWSGILNSRVKVTLKEIRHG